MLEIFPLKINKVDYILIFLAEQIPSEFSAVQLIELSVLKRLMSDIQWMGDLVL